MLFYVVQSGRKEAPARRKAGTGGLLRVLHLEESIRREEEGRGKIAKLELGRLVVLV